MKLIKHFSSQTQVSQPCPQKLHNDDSRTTRAVAGVDFEEVETRSSTYSESLTLR